jgi:hypothetical protein
MSIKYTTQSCFVIPTNGDSFQRHDFESEEKKTFPLSKLNWQITKIENNTNYVLQCETQTKDVLYIIEPRKWKRCSSYVTTDHLLYPHFFALKPVECTEEKLNRMYGVIDQPNITLQGQPQLWPRQDNDFPENVVIGTDIFECKYHRFAQIYPSNAFKYMKLITG